METVTDFIFLGFKITEDADCSHEIKRFLLLGRKAMTNFDILLKSRHYFPDRGPSSQTYGFSSSQVRMWELDHKVGWVLMNWCFQLCCWRRLLRVPWTTKRSNQYILKEINPEYLLERLLLKQKLQYFVHLMQRPNHLEKTLMLGKIEAGGERDDRGQDGWMHHWLNGHEFEQAPGDGGGQGSLMRCSSWGCKELDITGLQRVGHHWTTEGFSVTWFTENFCKFYTLYIMIMVVYCLRSPSYPHLSFVCL